MIACEFSLTELSAAKVVILVFSKLMPQFVTAFHRWPNLITSISLAQAITVLLVITKPPEPEGTLTC